MPTAIVLPNAEYTRRRSARLRGPALQSLRRRGQLRFLVARRTASGWQSTALIPASLPGCRAAGLRRRLDQAYSISGSARAQPTVVPGSLTPLVAKEAPQPPCGPTVILRRPLRRLLAPFLLRQRHPDRSDTLRSRTAGPRRSKKRPLRMARRAARCSQRSARQRHGHARAPNSPSPSPDTHAVSEDGTRSTSKTKQATFTFAKAVKPPADQRPGPLPQRLLPTALKCCSTDGCLYSLESES